MIRILTILGDFFGTDPESLNMEPLPRRGSERIFFRLSLEEERTFIVVLYDPSRTENSLYAEIAHFLGRIGVPVPKVFLYLEEENLLVLEDVGNRDLYSLRDLPWEDRKPFYEKVLLAILKLHRYPLSIFQEENVKTAPPFDRRLYEWEREYFIENFLKGIASLEVEESSFMELTEEFEKLTTDLLSVPPCLIHRDLQSQNIMVRDEKIYLIDFQGMRAGNPFYDIASLIYDPYVRLSEEEREQVLDFYLAERPLGFSFEESRRALYKASIQRLMQALGAFGFLARNKGLKEFLIYVPQALRNLYYVLSLDGQMPKLKELVLTCMSRCGVN